MCRPASARCEQVEGPLRDQPGDQDQAVLVPGDQAATGESRRHRRWGLSGSARGAEDVQVFDVGVVERRQLVVDETGQRVGGRSREGQLFEQKRVAARASDELGARIDRQRGSYGVYECERVIVLKSLEVYSFGVDVGERRDHGVGRLARAGRGDQRYPPAEWDQQVESAGIGPVEVVEHQHGSVEQRAGSLRGVVGVPIPEWAPDGRLHELAAAGGYERERRAPTHGLVRGLGERECQRRLPNTRWTDQHHRTPRGQGRLSAVDLLVATE